MAAADALTFAPETFREFYNQRRRWAPSTMANIIDLLSSFKSTVNKNDNISYLYMFYQFVLFFTSILSPGTTLLMIGGSYNAVLGTDQLQSNLLALGPIVLFILICFTTKPDTHVLVAMLLSAVYAIIMTIVIVGTVVNAIDESLTSPNIVFMVTLVGFFVLAGLFHPQELTTLVSGIIYFLVFPSAYLLLPLYALCNLNVVSWGTREVARKKTKEELEEEKRAEEERLRKAATKSKGLLNWLGLDRVLQDLKFFYTSMMSRVTTSGQQGQLGTAEEGESIMEMKENISQLKAVVFGEKQRQHSTTKKPNELRDMLQKKAQHNPSSSAPGPRHSSKGANMKRKATTEKSGSDKTKVKRDDLVNPAWLEDTGTGSGPITALDNRENIFWRQVIRIHLKPIEKNKVKEKQMEEALVSLRNSIVFAFLMLNFLWNIVIFQMQLLKDKLEEFFIPIPRADDPEGTFMRFEPMGFAFLGVFGVVLFLQFVGMVIHRWHTLLHILSRTEIRHSENSKEGKLKLAEKLQSINDFDFPVADYDDDDDDDTGEDSRNGSNAKRFATAGRDNDSGVGEFDSRKSSLSYREDRRDSEYRQAREHQPLPAGATGHHYRKHAAPYGPHYPSPRSRYQRNYPGQIHVRPDTLSRNFMRRYNYLQGNIKPSPHNSKQVVHDMEMGAVIGHTSQQASFDDIYQTLRGPYGHRRSPAGRGYEGYDRRPVGHHYFPSGREGRAPHYTRYY